MTDAIDLSTVTIVGSPDVRAWPATAELVSLDFSRDGVNPNFTREDGADRWPDVRPPGWDGPIQFTLWMLCQIRTVWHGAGGIEFWHGLERSGGPPSQFGVNWFYNPDVWPVLGRYQPAPGERVGFMVTAGDARAKDIATVRERSNIITVPFPTDAGAVFTFGATPAPAPTPAPPPGVLFDGELEKLLMSGDRIVAGMQAIVDSNSALVSRLDALRAQGIKLRW